MAVLDAILPVVGRSSNLALELYKRSATLHGEAATELTRVAKAISAFGSILKQLGTIIKEDDSLPSHEAIEALDNVIEQSRSVFSQIDQVISSSDSKRRNEQHNGSSQYSSRQQEAPGRGKLNYLQSHLEALRTTLSVMLQSLYTTQTIMWSKLQPTVSPRKVEETVMNEKTQLETMIIEQQISILSAFRAYELNTRVNAHLLMEEDSSQSLVLTNYQESPRPAELCQYQDNFISNLKTSGTDETEWLPSICSIASPHSESVLDRWTSLPQFDARLRDAELKAVTQKREFLQPMVESDEDDDSDQQRKLAGNGTRMAHKSDYVQPLFTEIDNSSVPRRDTRYGPAAPLSPAASPRTSRDGVTTSVNDQSPTTSARSSISNLPVEATAAVEAKEEDDDVDLEIPWTLCTRKYYWKYVDNKVVSSNTKQLPSIAFLERNNWTEIMASWVCREAIKEAGYGVTQVQKDRRDGRRTRFETCFCIDKPLQFQQVKELVERTVEIYRQSKPATPPPPPSPHVRRSSFNRPPPPPMGPAYANGIDRDRTPIPQRPTNVRSTTAVPQRPTNDRSATAMLIPPAMPPGLDRSLSSPGIGTGPMSIPGPPQSQKTHPSNLQIPMPLPQYSTSMPQGPFPPPPPMQAPYPPQIYNSPQVMYPPNSGFQNPPPLPPHMQPHNMAMPQSPLRRSHLHPHARSRYDDDYTTTDSDSNERERRRQRSKSRSRYTTDKKKKSHTKSKAAGALLGVGGLTALLDGLSGL